MGFIVQTGTSSVGSDSVERIPNAESIHVEEGHLYVADEEGIYIAIYAPQHWTGAVKDDEVTSGWNRQGTTYNDRVKKE